MERYNIEPYKTMDNFVEGFKKNSVRYSNYKYYLNNGIYVSYFWLYEICVGHFLLLDTDENKKDKNKIIRLVIYNAKFKKGLMNISIARSGGYCYNGRDLELDVLYKLLDFVTSDNQIMKIDKIVIQKIPKLYINLLHNKKSFRKEMIEWRKSTQECVL